MWLRILGSAAGGAFPQWNCNCPNCRGVRDGSLSCRTQSSIAVSADYRHWFLFNASPDVRSQIEAFPPLWPQEKVRHTPIQAIVLSDAEIDHTLGLLSLREAGRLRLYATEWVYNALSAWNPILRTLRAYCELDWQPIRLDTTIALCGPRGLGAGIDFLGFSVPSTKAVAFAPEGAVHPEAVIGFRLSDARTNCAMAYLPAVQELNATVMQQMQGCRCVLFDGTCWEDEELIRLGILEKTARTMGHLPVGGVGGSLEQLATLEVDRKLLIHINNTNPLLIENSPQRRSVEARGIEIAFDGMMMEI